MKYFEFVLTSTNDIKCEWEYFEFRRGFTNFSSTNDTENFRLNLFFVTC